MLKREGNKYDDLIGFLGGVICLIVSEVDTKWGLFWFGAGVLLIAWSAISFWLRGRRDS